MADFFLPVNGGKTPSVASATRKRPRSEKQDASGSKKSAKPERPKKRAKRDEALESASSGSDNARVDFKLLQTDAVGDDDGLATGETAYAARKRLAKQYLASMDAALHGRRSRPDGIGPGRGYGPDLLSGSGSQSGSDRDEVGLLSHRVSDRRGGDAVGEALRKEAMRASGRFQQRVAGSLSAAALGAGPSSSHFKHKLPATCVAVNAAADTVVSGGKDCCIVRWDLGSDTKTVLRGFRGRPEVGGHTGHVFAVACADDGQHMVSAGADSLIRLWDLRTNSIVDTFTGHRGAVHALAFRQGTQELYSGGADRVLKLWHIGDRAYIESQFGHEGAILGLDALTRDRVVSASDDTSVRVFKITEQKNLQFKTAGPVPSAAESVALINEAQFVAGARDGGISVFTSSKRKPLCSVAAAHGAGQWITAVAALRNTDLLASGAGANSGLKLWQLAPHASALTPVADLACRGFVNGIAFARSGAFVVAAVGSEHRLGRWWREPGAKNGVLLWRLGIDTNAAEVLDVDA